MRPKIKLGEYDVLESGSILIPNGESADFSFHDVTIKISFVLEENAPIEIKSIPISDKLLEIKLVNQTNALATGNQVPAEIVSLSDGKKINLLFACTNFGKNNIFYYTFLIK